MKVQITITLEVDGDLFDPPLTTTTEFRDYIRECINGLADWPRVLPKIEVKL